MKQIEKIKGQILKILKDKDSQIFPRKLIEDKLSTEYDFEIITDAINALADDFQLGMVLEYPSEETGISAGRPIWHLKIINKEEVKELQSLPAIEQALLRLLFRADDTRLHGEIPIDEAKKLLAEQGFPEDDVQYLFIKDRVETVSLLLYGRSDSVLCFRLIPENEKTEEYKQEEERIFREWDKKDQARQYRTDVLDLADLIIETVRKSEERISKEEIIDQLPDFPSNYINDAFATVIGDKDIELIEEKDGVEWYRLSPKGDEDEDY